MNFAILVLGRCFPLIITFETFYAPPKKSRLRDGFRPRAVSLFAQGIWSEKYTRDARKSLQRNLVPRISPLPAPYSLASGDSRRMSGETVSPPARHELIHTEADFRACSCVPSRSILVRLSLKSRKGNDITKPNSSPGPNASDWGLDRCFGRPLLAGSVRCALLACCYLNDLFLEL